jgi:hypothetical protein
MSKLCKKCNQTKDLDQFNPNPRLKDGYENRCRTCRNKQQNASYAQSRDHKRQQMKAWRKANPDRARINNHYSVKVLKDKCQVIRKQILTQNPCLICKEDRTPCLDFHHLDPKTKKSAVTFCRSYTSLMNEVNKCVVLCSNCHRLHHAQELPLPPNTQPLALTIGMFIPS